jgi:hypothetical protein
MYYLFFDESYSCNNTHTKVILASWTVDQERWSRQAERPTELYRTPVSQTISSVFDSLDARATVATAELDNTLFRSGETDGTDDIAAMARTDNVWSHCSIFGVGGLIRDCVEAGQEIATVDIHFDPKSLKLDHSEAVRRTYRELVVSEAKRYALERGFTSIRNLTIRRIEPVEKPNPGQPPNKFQMGTWIADRLCANADEIAQVRSPRIRSYDISEVVRKTVQQFDGIPFHQDGVVAVEIE